MSILDEIETAPMGDMGGRYLPPDFIGDVRVETVEEFKTRNKGEAFIVTFQVLSCTSKADVEIGGTYSWFQKINDSAPREIKNFLAACTGFDPYDPAGQAGFASRFSGKAGRELYSAAVSKDNTLETTNLHVETYGKKTRGGGDFTVHRWTPAAGAPKAAAAPPAAPPPAADPRAGWREETFHGVPYLLDPTKNEWVPK